MFTGFIATVCQLTRFSTIFSVVAQYANAKYHWQPVVITGQKYAMYRQVSQQEDYLG